MTRITLDRATLELLHDLSEPLEFCDEAGWLLGTFMPAAHELAGAAARTEREHGHKVEEGLGPELGIYGYEQDLE